MEKTTSIRLSDELSYKIRYIAKKNHRKINDEFRMMIEKHIYEYEKNNGPIFYNYIEEN